MQKTLTRITNAEITKEVKYRTLFEKYDRMKEREKERNFN